MKVESRIEALEHELKILKNEIQATLLEIREQVLNHYYPELRAEEPVRPKLQPAKASESRSNEAREPRMNEIRTNEVQVAELPRSTKSAPTKAGGQPRGQAATPPAAAGKVKVQPFSDIFLQDMEGINLDDVELDEEEIQIPRWDESEDEEIHDEIDEEEEAPAPVRAASPQLREVGMQQLKQSGAAPKPRVKPNPVAAETPSPKPSRRNFAALAAWVGGAVGKVGKERATQVVETYAASGGALSNETKGSLMQLIALASDEEPSGAVGNQEMLGLMVELDQLLAD